MHRGGHVRCGSAAVQGQTAGRLLRLHPQKVPLVGRSTVPAPGGDVVRCPELEGKLEVDGDRYRPRVPGAGQGRGEQVLAIPVEVTEQPEGAGLVVLLVDIASSGPSRHSALIWR